MENDELAQYLDALEREDCYRVDAILKESPHELTQQVSFIGKNGSARGPYIRKYIKRQAGMGVAYERLFAAQRSGRRFVYLPIVLDCYMREDYLVVIMEYVRGDTLQELVYQKDPSLQLAQNVFPRLCDAITELHECFDPPIIHRDLKPSNVIVSEGGLTIIDFGIAREFKEGAGADTVQFGTRSFAPPEQYGFGQTTERTDVYALGMLLYYCLTEVIPDTSDRKGWYVDQRVPAALRGVIAKATAFDPLHRYASAAELKAAFSRALDEKSEDAAMPSDVPERGNAPQDAQVWGTASQDAQTWEDAPQDTRHWESAAQGSQARGGAPHNSREQQAVPPLQGAKMGRQADSPDSAKARPRTSIRNIIVALLFVVFSVYSIGRVSNPPQSNIGYPDWYNMLTLGVIIPLLYFVIAFAAWDKTNLKERFPLVGKLRVYHYIIAFVAVFVFFAVCLAVIRAVMHV